VGIFLPCVNIIRYAIASDQKVLCLRIPANSPQRVRVRTIMEFAYDHVLIESRSPAEEIGVHTAAACAENETRRYTY